MEYIEEERRDREDITEVEGFWTKKNQLIAVCVVAMFVTLVGIFLIGTWISDGGDEDDGPVNPDFSSSGMEEVREWVGNVVFRGDRSRYF